MQNELIIQMTGYVLILYQSELTQLLAQNPELWKVALKRGKGYRRAKRVDYFYQGKK